MNPRNCFLIKVILSCLVVVATGCANSNKPVSAKPTSEQPTCRKNVVWLLDAERYPKDEFLTATVLQGFGNREKPGVYLYTGPRNWCARFLRQWIHHSEQTLQSYPGFSTDDVWIEYFSGKKQKPFVTNTLQPDKHFDQTSFVKSPHGVHDFYFYRLEGMDELVEKVAPTIKGLVLYDINSPIDWVVGSALASGLDLLPVTEDVLAKHPSLKAFEIKENLLGRFDPNTDNLKAQKWAYSLVADKCTKKSAYSMSGKGSLFDDPVFNIQLQSRERSEGFSACS